MSKKFIYIFLFISVQLIPIEEMFAQNRFSAGIVAGVTAAQIDGDLYAGYDKLGLSAGLRATTFIQDKWDISFELLFSQRGSQSELVPKNTILQQKIHLNYVSVPVMVGYNDWYDEELDMYHFQVQAGLSYARLISSKIQDGIVATEIEENFNSDDLSFLIGVTYFSNNHLGFSVKYNRAISFLFNTNKHDSINARSLVSKFIDFQVLYMF